MQRVRVAVHAADALSQAGITRCLGTWADIEVLPPRERAAADVVVRAPDRLTPQVLAELRADARRGEHTTVLVADRFGEADLLVAVECRVMSVLPRAAAGDQRLRTAVLAAAARQGVAPPDLLGELVAHLERLRGEGLTAQGLASAGLSPREVDVLRLMAEGLDTAEIARELSYSQRTVKNIIYGFTSRLRLRNRSHAVAYAVRAGVI